MLTTLSTASSTFTPVITPRPGHVSNPNASNGLFPFLVLTEVLCVGLTTVFMLIRIGVRLLIMRVWAVEDWLCMLSWGLYLVYAAIEAVGVHAGAGQHEWDVDMTTLKHVLYWIQVSQIEYDFAILAIKLTLLCFYLTLFAPVQLGARWWAIVVAMALNTLFYIGLTFVKIFLCDPRQASWDPTIVDKHCGDEFVMLIISSVWNTVSDIVILVFPFMFIWKLDLDNRRRLALIGVFAVGSIAPIFNILGIAMRVVFLAHADDTWGMWRISFFAFAELTAGLLCTCLPSLPRLYRYIRGDRPRQLSERELSWFPMSPSQKGLGEVALAAAQDATTSTSSSASQRSTRTLCMTAEQRHRNKHERPVNTEAWLRSATSTFVDAADFANSGEEEWQWPPQHAPGNGSLEPLTAVGIPEQTAVTDIHAGSPGGSGGEGRCADEPYASPGILATTDIRIELSTRRRPSGGLAEMPDGVAAPDYFHSGDDVQVSPLSTQFEE